MGPTLGAILFSGNAASTRERAAQVEALGFASISVPDHLGYFPPLTACAIVAEATERVQIGPLVLNNDFRHPVVLAHEAMALADLSGGRFELGLGAGYARREYERAGIPFSPRGVRIARLAESARILRALFAGETVDFDGEHYQVHGQALPAHDHRVPILIGGNSAAIHTVAAEHADIVGLAGSAASRAAEKPDYVGTAVERQVERLRAAPRFAELELHVLVQSHEVTSDREGAAERAASGMETTPDVVLSSPYVLIGTPEEIAAQLREQHERYGITRWTIFADRPDLEPAESLVPVLRLLARA
jgi:probable F420-dependent oxidoreductase